MPRRPLRPCRQPGCGNLVESGYCPAHQHKEQESKRTSFRRLDEKKTPEIIRFYRSYRWTEKSLNYRKAHPLCERCLKKGSIVLSKITHHDPPLEELLAKKLNPFDDQYLEAVCLNCHQEELRKKQKSS